MASGRSIWGGWWARVTFSNMSFRVYASFSDLVNWQGRTTRNRVDLENCRVYRDAEKISDVYVLLQPCT